MQPVVILLHSRQCIMIDDDIHDQLVKAYLEYFKANENFEKRLSYRTHRATRKWLREIRRLSKIRGDEIHEKFKTKMRQKNNKHGKYHYAVDLRRQQD